MTEVLVLLTAGAIKEGYAYVQRKDAALFPEDAWFARDKKDFPKAYIERGLKVAESAVDPKVRPVSFTFVETGAVISVPIAVKPNGAMRPEARRSFKDYYCDVSASAGDALTYRKTGERSYDVMLRRRG